MIADFDLSTALITLAGAGTVAWLVSRIRRKGREYLGHILDAFFWFADKVLYGAVATRVSLRQYCAIGLEDPRTKHMVVPGRRRRPLITDELFVPLRLDSEDQTRQDLEIDELLSTTSRLRIIGDPGSGKSSLVKWIFRHQCRQARRVFRRRRTDELPLRLPIIVHLKDFSPPAEVTSSADRAAWALSQLREAVVEVHGFGMAKLFDAYSRDRGLVVLLDGLDEVATDQYAATAETILALSRRLAALSNRHTVALTMRSQFHQQIHRDFDPDFPPVAHIERFSTPDIYSFLTKWPFGDAQAEEVPRIYGELTDHPSLKEMCRNPLVLAMFVASEERVVTDDEAAALYAGADVDTRTLFYEDVVDELLAGRGSRRVGMRSSTGLLRQRYSILGELALRNLLDAGQHTNRISWDDAVRRVRREYPQASEEEAESHLEFLARDTGLLDEEQERETLRFIHLTFCEFLAARQAARAEQDGWATLLQRYSTMQRAASPQVRTRLREVVPFAVALVSDAERDGALEMAWQLGDSIVLGRCFLETQAYDHARWPDYVERETRFLRTASVDEWSSEWLERLYLFTVVARGAKEWAAATRREVDIPLDSLFSELVGSDRERLLALFSAYAEHDAAAAFRLAAACEVDLSSEHPELVIRHCSDAAFLEIAIQKALTDAASAARWAPVLAEAGLRQPAAADLMSRRHVPSERVPYFRASDRRHDWESISGLTNWAYVRHAPLSCYAAMLTLGTEAENLKHLECTRRLASFRAPGSILSRLRRAISVAPLVTFGVAAFVALAALMTTEQPRSNSEQASAAAPLWAWIAVLAFVVVALWLGILLVGGWVSHASERLYLYRVLLGLESQPDKRIKHGARRLIADYLTPSGAARLTQPRLYSAARDMMKLRRTRLEDPAATDATATMRTAGDETPIARVESEREPAG